MSIEVNISGPVNNTWTITSTGSAIAPGIIAVNPSISLPQVGVWVKFAEAVSKGNSPASTGPYFIDILTSFTAPTAGGYGISASATENGTYCSAHPITVGRGGTGGS